MFNTIAWFADFILSIVIMIPQMLKVKNMPDDTKGEYVQNITSKWALRRVKKSKATVLIYGQENVPKDETVLFVSNHQGNFDVALFLAYVNKKKGYVAKSELLKIPLLRTWMKYLNCVCLDRSDIKSSAKAIIDGIKILKSGHSLVVFPEGTRSKGQAMGNFKEGSFKLATKAKVSIVPVTINGSYKIMEEHNRITRATVEMTIHPPVPTNGISKEEEALLPAKIKCIIENALHTA